MSARERAPAHVNLVAEVFEVGQSRRSDHLTVTLLLAHAERRIYRVSLDDCRKLGSYLYRRVRITGAVTERPRTLRVASVEMVP